MRGVIPMKCPNCGSENAAGSKFCTECGAVLPAAPQPTPSPQPAAPQTPAYQQSAPQTPAYQQHAQQQAYQPPAPQPAYPPQAPVGQPYAQNPVAPKKRSAAPVIAVVAAVAVLAVLAVILAPKLLKAKSPVGAGRDTTDAVSGLVTEADATSNAEPSSDATTEAVISETETEMRGAPDNDFTGLFADWTDASGRELYITADGKFFFSEPDGYSDGHIRRDGGTYGMYLAGGAKLHGDASLVVPDDRQLEYRSGGRNYPLDPFLFEDVYPAGERLIWMAWKEDAPDYAIYDSQVIDSDEYAAKMLLMTDFPVTDVKILALELEDVAQDGTLSFRSRELYSQPVLLRTRPLELTLVMEGSIPTRGVSYTDPGGYTYRYAISVSGMDGSLILSPF